MTSILDHQALKIRSFPIKTEVKWVCNYIDTVYVLMRPTWRPTWGGATHTTAADPEFSKLGSALLQQLPAGATSQISTVEGGKGTDAWFSWFQLVHGCWCYYL